MLIIRVTIPYKYNSGIRNIFKMSNTHHISLKTVIVELIDNESDFEAAHYGNCCHLTCKVIMTVKTHFYLSLKQIEVNVND